MLSMNTLTTGLRVRFLRVTITIGHGLAGISSESAFSAKRPSLCAQHVRSLGSESLLSNLMEVKD